MIAVCVGDEDQGEVLVRARDPACEPPASRRVCTASTRIASRLPATRDAFARPAASLEVNVVTVSGASAGVVGVPPCNEARTRAPRS